jgi:hypothetical protein
VIVPLFRRGRPEGEPDSDPTSGSDSHGELDADPGEPTDDDATGDKPVFLQAPEDPAEPQDPPFSREDGPFDESEAPEVTVARLDLGGLKVPGVPGVEIRLEVDEETGNVVSVSGVLEEGAVQMQAFGAPRTQGVWREVRLELAEGIRSAGGSARDVDGPFGRELHAKVPVETEQGRGLQDARFVGVDGPRWFLRGVFSGTAYQPGAQPVLEELFRGCVVVRGSAPLAPKGPIPLSLPGDIEDGVEGRPPLEPFTRGPEITEIH